MRLYFGGKSAVAAQVWRALGQPKHYIEPFFGSGAVLLLRPYYQPGKHIETVCDKDGFVANVWRAIQADPDEVAKWCDWPVNHADLSARKRRLIANEDRLLENLIADDEWFDAKLAGYWIWAASCWIGSGLTSTGMPHITDGGTGVHKTGLGQRPHLSDGGTGVHVPNANIYDWMSLGQVPSIGHAGKGVHVPNANIYDWMRRLSERLRHVRVVCGDWSRVCGGKWQDKIGPCGMFFDPPYAVKDRAAVYHHDSTTVADDVRAWCLERGAIPTYRIVLAGYEEHEELIDHGWTAETWATNGGYAHTARDGKQDNRGKVNRKREALYYSPACIRGPQQKEMFE